MKKYIIVTILIGIHFAGIAQNDKKVEKKTKLIFHTEVGYVGYNKSENGQISQVDIDPNSSNKGGYRIIPQPVYNVQSGGGLTINQYVGYNFHKRFNGGLNIGYDQYKNFGFIPITMAIRYKIGNVSNLRPKLLLQSDFGKSVILSYPTSEESNAKSQFSGSFLAGFCFPNQSGTSFTLSAGVKTQMFEYRQASEFYKQETQNKLHRMVIKLGFLF